MEGSCFCRYHIREGMGLFVFELTGGRAAQIELPPDHKFS